MYKLSMLQVPDVKQLSSIFRSWAIQNYVWWRFCLDSDMIIQN